MYYLWYRIIWEWFILWYRSYIILISRTVYVLVLMLPNGSLPQPPDPPVIECCLCVHRNCRGKGGDGVWDSHAYHILSAGGWRREPVPPRSPLRGVLIIPQPGFRSTKLLHTDCGGAAGGFRGVKCQGVLQCAGCERQPACFQPGNLLHVSAWGCNGWHLLPNLGCVRWRWW